ncbi:MAG: response regulator transcription factor [Deltaproteobacteria bacterium]|nr:response regulator transcription factor [Deltaproteobacteria bacterium]
MREEVAVPRILFVEDDLSLRASLAYVLEREGYELSEATTGEEALARAATVRPDVVLLDVNLPGMDGFEVCARLRRLPATAAVPIVLVTARTEIDDVCCGFERRADDYITKPFHPRVLLARLQAVLRRVGPPAAEAEALRFRGLVIDPATREVFVEERRIELTRTEFDLLSVFAGQPHRVFTRADVLDRLRGEDAAITDRAVDVQVSGLRRKLGSSGRCIETVRGVGYRFHPDP